MARAWLSFMLYAVEPRTWRPTRARLHDLVRRAPGLPLSQIARDLELSRAAAWYHLSRLVRDGLVTTRVVGRRRLVFPTTTREDAALATALAILQGATARRVAEAIALRPGLSVLELCEATGESQRALYYHLKLFRDAQLIETRPRGRYARIEPAPALLEALVSLRSPR